jgi:hypothetical protein
MLPPPFASNVNVVRKSKRKGKLLCVIDSVLPLLMLIALPAQVLKMPTPPPGEFNCNVPASMLTTPVKPLVLLRTVVPVPACVMVPLPLKVLAAL